MNKNENKNRSEGISKNTPANKKTSRSKDKIQTSETGNRNKRNNDSPKNINQKKGPADVNKTKEKRLKAAKSLSTIKDRNRNNNNSNNISNSNSNNKNRNNSNRKSNRQNNSNSRRKLHPLRVIPLGGMREIGKNMFLYEYANDIIIVDCGIGFPEEDMPGIDVVIPDMSYVFENKNKIRGIFITHGHEDHIGAIAWLTNEVHAPIYGNRLVIALIESRIEDRGGQLSNLDLRPVSDDEIIRAGAFSVEFIHANHSIADANVLAISTPLGVVVHTGDFKIDFAPTTGESISLHRLAQIGMEEPLLLMCESTNIERPGISMSEGKVGEAFASIFEKTPGRIIIATFSSNIHRIQQIFYAAEKFHKKVCLLGRSVINTFEAADSLGYLKYKPSTLVELNRVHEINPSDMVLITTGSQGEPLSALSRIAYNEHHTIDIVPGDTVIFSSTPIPGNERSVYRLIDELYLKGANVIYSSLAEVHASGHAYQEEIKLIHSLVKSRYFVPMHGDYRMLVQHSQLAQKMGRKEESIFLLKNGDVFEITSEGAGIVGEVQAGGIMVDGAGFADPQDSVLKERTTLADEGVVSISMAVDIIDNILLGEPVVITKGFLYESESEEIVTGCISKIYSFIRKNGNSGKELSRILRENTLKSQIRDYLFNKTKRKPLILISIIEID